MTILKSICEGEKSESFVKSKTQKEWVGAEAEIGPSRPNELINAHHNGEPLEKSELGEFL